MSIEIYQAKNCNETIFCDAKNKIKNNRTKKCAKINYTKFI